MTLVVSGDRDLDASFHSEEPPPAAVVPDPDASERGPATGERQPGETTLLAGAKDRTDALLAALTQMAALSLRRQADVAVAMRRAGLTFSPEIMAAALEQLRRDGSIEPPLFLSDGGILVSVTVRGIEHLATTAYRHVAVTLMSRGLA